MVNIDTYLQGLENLNANLDVFIADVIKKNEGQIVGWIKNRLYQKGIAGDGSFLGHYSEGYENLKKLEGKRSSHVTLRDEGDFYRGMFAEYKNKLLTIDSKDGKTPSLVEKYGERILELTEMEQEILIDGIIEQALVEYTRSLGEIISAGSTGSFFSAQ